LIISPFIDPKDPDFEKHIENGMLSIVQELNKAGLSTVDSCHGHFQYGDNPHVTFVIDDVSQYSGIHQKLKSPFNTIQLLPAWFPHEAPFNNWYVFVNFNNLTYWFAKYTFLRGIKRYMNDK